MGSSGAGAGRDACHLRVGLSVRLHRSWTEPREARRKREGPRARRGVCQSTFTASSRSQELCSKGGDCSPTRSGIICFFVFIDLKTKWFLSFVESQKNVDRRGLVEVAGVKPLLMAGPASDSGPAPKLGRLPRVISS